jgi:hypothetical protein
MRRWLSRGRRWEVSRAIPAPADVLYEMVSDLSRMGEWSPENLGGRWRRGSGPTLGGRFKGRNKRGPLRWTTNVEVTAAQPGRLFEFVVHLVWPLTYLVTWGYRFESQHGSTLVTQYRQDHRPTWFIWVGSKYALQISDPGAHYIAGMEATLEALAEACRRTDSLNSPESTY